MQLESKDAIESGVTYVVAGLAVTAITDVFNGKKINFGVPHLSAMIVGSFFAGILVYVYQRKYK